MPVIRNLNPFSRKNAPPSLHSTASSPASLGPNAASSSPRTSAEHDPIAKSPSAISFKKPEEDNTYKLSVVNDSGVYLPPSPPDKKSFWSRRSEASSISGSSKSRPTIAENEPFTISRESFDSYRRSFDISARSPISECSTPNGTRTSLDMYSRPAITGRMSLDARPTRLSLDSPRPSQGRLSLDSRRPPPVQDVEEPADEFEEVDLGEKKGANTGRRGFLARFARGDQDPHSSSGKEGGKSLWGKEEMRPLEVLRK